MAYSQRPPSSNWKTFVSVRQGLGAHHWSSSWESVQDAQTSRKGAVKARLTFTVLFALSTVKSKRRDAFIFIFIFFQQHLLARVKSRRMRSVTKNTLPPINLFLQFL